MRPNLRISYFLEHFPFYYHDKKISNFIKNMASPQATWNDILLVPFATDSHHTLPKICLRTAVETARADIKLS